MRHGARGILTALTFTLCTSTALAEQDFFVSGSVGLQHRSVLDESRSYPLINGRISAAGALSPIFNAQGDIIFEYRRYDEDVFYNQVASIEGAMHFFYRDPESFLLGGFVQYGNQWETFGGMGTFTTESTLLYGGLEGQVYFDNLTLYGQVGVSRRLYEDLIAFTGPFVTAEVRYFLTPDFKVDLHGSVFRNVAEADIATETIGIGIGAEYRLTDYPISILGSLDHYAGYFGGNSTATDTRLLVGLKFNFGADTLLDRDRNGASLNPVAHVPFIDLLP